MYWTAKNHMTGDLTIVRLGDEYHLFTEQCPFETGGMTIGHAISRNLFEWEEFTLRAIAYREMLEIYIDDRLMIMQIRYREQKGRIGFSVERDEACFLDARLRRFK